MPHFITHMRRSSIARHECYDAPTIEAGCLLAANGALNSLARIDSRNASAVALRWTSSALTLTVWVSAALFGLYILAFYAAALAEGAMAKWNTVLPDLYRQDRPVGTLGIGLHFAAGGIILALGCIQLVPAIRARVPSVHRWIGRVYVVAAICAGIGGLTFILVNGTIGGIVMDIGFGLYGALMVLAAIQAIRHARAARFDLHRAWALRLFALAIGSWLYRMDYGFWMLLADGAGTTRDFRGPFDRVMVFFFYVPNLLIVEALIRAPAAQLSSATRVSLSALYVLATGFLWLGTYYFTKLYWGPAIIARLT